LISETASRLFPNLTFLAHPILTTLDRSRNDIPKAGFSSSQSHPRSKGCKAPQKDWIPKSSSTIKKTKLSKKRRHSPGTIPQRLAPDAWWFASPPASRP